MYVAAVGSYSLQYRLAIIIIIIDIVLMAIIIIAIATCECKEFILEELGYLLQNRQNVIIKYYDNVIAACVYICSYIQCSIYG